MVYHLLLYPVLIRAARCGFDWRSIDYVAMKESYRSLLIDPEGALDYVRIDSGAAIDDGMC